MNQPDAVTALAALAQPHRLAAFRALVQAGRAGLAVGELREAPGLVLDTREGRSIRVHAAHERMDALLAYLTENCCGGEPCCP
jgi:hypothetical protein